MNAGDIRRIGIVNAAKLDESSDTSIQQALIASNNRQNTIRQGGRSPCC